VPVKRFVISMLSWCAAIVLWSTPWTIGIPFQAVQTPAPVALDLSGLRPGPVSVDGTRESVTVQWQDESSRPWTAVFSLDPAQPLITAISVDGKPIVERARPLYWCETGKRRGGWDQFFDFPPSHPEGTRRFAGELKLRSAKARTVGDRVEILFEGLRIGIFDGGVAYTFYPGSRLIQQEAVVKTAEPDTAYFYDTGIRMAAVADARPGGNMDSQVSYYDTQGRLQVAAATGPERRPHTVRYRAIATRLSNGSMALFPAPHQYFFARDFTSNLGSVWSRAWRGEIALGIRQLPDDNTSFYPWMNAPPGTLQRMGVFYLFSDREPQAVLEEVLRYTHRDRFAPLEGHKTLATHWHLAYTVQAMAKGFDWTPPFKPVLKDMGVDAAMIMDFHGDGHPRDLTDLRLKELEAYYRACRAQSDASFLLIPAEEANVHLGGHWALSCPKPVYWFMSRAGDAPFRSKHPEHGLVYRTGNAGEVIEMIRSEGGILYQTHPRTKGSMGFPDQIRETDYFRDERYLGGGWKAMPSDLSTLREGVRALNLLDDMNNWGLRKRLLGEVDVFQIDSTHELYAHMNVNYVRMTELPSFDRYGLVLEAVSRGDYFISTGEVLLPEVSIAPGSSGAIKARAKVLWTFPLSFAEIVWSDGRQTERQIIPLDTTRAFSSGSFDWEAGGANWKWARVAVWDIAGNGAFVNPVWRERQPSQ
jgi:hypothetical protein